MCAVTSPRTIAVQSPEEIESLAPQRGTPVLLLEIRQLLRTATDVHLPRLLALRSRLGVDASTPEPDLEEALLVLHETATGLDLADFTEEAFALRAVRKLQAGAERLQQGLSTLTWHANQLWTLVKAYTEGQARADFVMRTSLVDLQIEARALARVLEQARALLDALERDLASRTADSATSQEALDELRRRCAALRERHRRLDALRRSAETAHRLSLDIVATRQALLTALQDCAIQPAQDLQQQLRPLAEQPDQCSDALAAHDARSRLQYGLVQASALVARLLRLQDKRATRLGALAWADSTFN